jgi:hypothetical protein
LSVSRAEGVTRTTIANDLKLEGVKLRPRGRPRKLRPQLHQLPERAQAGRTGPVCTNVRRFHEVGADPRVVTPARDFLLKGSQMSSAELRAAPSA